MAYDAACTWSRCFSCESRLDGVAGHVEQRLPERLLHVGRHEVARRDEQVLGAAGDSCSVLEDRVRVVEVLDGAQRATVVRPDLLRVLGRHVLP